MKKIVALLASTALSLTACGGTAGPDPAEDPKAALVSALESMEEYDGVELDISLDTDTDSLVAVSEGELQREDAETIAASSINIKSVSAEDPDEAQSEMVADIEGNAVEMRMVDKVVYLRGDVRELAERFGASQEELDQAAREAPPEFDFIGPALDGEWIAIENLEQLQEQMGIPTPDPEAQQQMAEDLKRAVEEEAQVTSEGDDDVGHHLVATMGVREMWQAIEPSLRSLASAGFPAESFPKASDLPDEEVSLDVWVADDKVEQMVLDFKQFEGWEDGEDFPEGVERLGLLMDVAEFTDDVEAPEDAHSVDAQTLMQMFGGGMGMGGEDGGAEDFCEQLQDAPADVQSQFADECPEFAQ